VGGLATLKRLASAPRISTMIPSMVPAQLVNVTLFVTVVPMGVVPKSTTLGVVVRQVATPVPVRFRVTGGWFKPASEGQLAGSSKSIVNVELTGPIL